MERQWPLTGRDAELRAVAAAVRPGAAGVLVAGPAGVGKTRLVREALAHPRGGARVVWSLGSRAARPFPLGAFAGLVDLPAADAPTAVTRVLDALARHRPLVLAVDDAHLLDELSALVVHRAVVRRVAPVVVTVRDGEPAPDPVTALWKDDLLPRLDVAPLDAATTAVLVARALGGPVESASAHRLWSLTRGTPLYLRHLLAGEVGAGRLSPASGLWSWSGDPALSPGLAALLGQQIGALDPPVRDVVDLVALGEPVPVAALLALTEPGAAEEAERRGLVRTGDPGDPPAARLAHPLYGEVRRVAMGAVRARRLRGLLADRLEDAADPIPRAVLLLDSDRPPDGALLERAAGAALGYLDLPLAERLARAAAEAATPEDAWRTRLLHASALSWLSRGSEADAVLRDLARSAPDGPLRALPRAYRAANLLWTLGGPDDARVVLAEALADGDAGPTRVVLEAMSAALDAALGDARGTLPRAVALQHRELPDDLTRVVVDAVVAAGAAVTGRRDLLDALAGGRTAPSPPLAIPVFGLTDWLVLGYRLAGDGDAAGAAAHGLVTSSADLPGPARLMGLVLAGHAALAAGRVADALTPLREAWAGLARSGHEFRFRARTLLGTAEALAGRPAAARALLDGLPAGQHPAYTLLTPDDLVGRAWCAAAEGAVSEAAALARDAAELARRRDWPAFEVLAWQTATQLGTPDDTDAVTRLDALATAVPGPRARAARAHARARSVADADGLEAAATAWERAGDLVAAGDAAAQAAEVHGRAGRAGSALSATARARRLAERSGARTPALAAALRPLPLTAREREIASLAARGLSNREIADRLTVSVRTVEGHLYRLGHKLDARHRDQLAELLGPGGSE